jgi:hypothetical protein
LRLVLTGALHLTERRRTAYIRLHVLINNERENIRHKLEFFLPVEDSGCGIGASLEIAFYRQSTSCLAPQDFSPVLEADIQLVPDQTISIQSELGTSKIKFSKKIQLPRRRYQYPFGLIVPFDKKPIERTRRAGQRAT